jgi:hypothetical protein
VNLDLRACTGLARPATDALMYHAWIRSAARLRTLDITGCRDIGGEAFMIVARGGAFCQELRACDTGFVCEAAELEEILRLSPALRHFSADACLANVPDALRLLGCAPLRLRSLLFELEDESFEEDDAAAVPPMRALAAALSGHTSLEELRFVNAQLYLPAVLEAVVDAAVALRVHTLEMEGCLLRAEILPALARLLRESDALTTLSIDNQGDLFSAAADYGVLASALRDNRTLTALGLIDMGFWHDATAAAALVGALAPHASLRSLNLAFNVVGAEQQAAGAALARLLESASLRTLHIQCCQLGDAGMRPVLAALRRNTRLRTLVCFDNDMSAAFARGVLLPAVRANTGLRELVFGDEHLPAAGAEALAEALVASRGDGAGSAAED